MTEENHGLEAPYTRDLQAVGDMATADNLATLDVLGWRLDTDLVGEPIWVSPDGETTVWTEACDGTDMLAVGGRDGVAVGYVPTIIATILAVEWSRLG